MKVYAFLCNCQRRERSPTTRCSHCGSETDVPVEGLFSIIIILNLIWCVDGNDCKASNASPRRTYLYFALLGSLVKQSLGDCPCSVDQVFHLKRMQE